MFNEDTHVDPEEPGWERKTIQFSTAQKKKGVPQRQEMGAVTTGSERESGTQAEDSHSTSLLSSPLPRPLPSASPLCTGRHAAESPEV
ncbi:hypothetical protein WMY93_006521 [Mugilogobius chulae]|uniref:Uncharacterized protein n=1 Tax=Mugilogobius chulae TaxID=88201 RepID=A0AAW0PMP9_9GOBI